MAIGNVPTLVDLDNADFVYRLVSDLQKKARPSEAELHAQNDLVTPSIPPRTIEDYPAETTRSAVNLAIAGQINRYRSTKIILSHGGGFLPYAVARFAELDRKAIETMGLALARSGRPFIVTSAIGMLPPGSLATERTMPPLSSPNPRVATENAARRLMERGCDVCVVRLPLSVHGDGDRGFVPTLIKIAREKGGSAYIGEGRNRWPAVHRFDAAQVFRLAMEKGPNSAYYHAVAEEGVPFREIAEVIGQRLKVPVISKTAHEAATHFAWFAHFASVNITASSTHTQEELGWRPTHPRLIADIDRPAYFGV